MQAPGAGPRRDLHVVRVGPSRICPITENNSLLAKYDITCTVVTFSANKTTLRAREIDFFTTCLMPIV